MTTQLRAPHYILTKTEPQQLGVFFIFYFLNTIFAFFSIPWLPAPTPTFLHHIPLSFYPLHDPLLPHPHFRFLIPFMDAF
jgi:hypothetical protein